MTDSLSFVYAVPVMVGLAVASLSAAGLSAALEARDRGLSVRSGLTVPLRETARLLRQRPRRTVSADRLLWRSASSSVIPLAVLIVAFVPLGAHALVDHPLGLVWVNAFDVVAWAVMWLLGWGANSITGVVGGYRFLALALGYELPLMFALTAPAIAASSLNLAEISAAQGGLWFVVWAPVAFAAYCWGVLGFSVRPPMDPGAGIDVNGGILAELAGVDRLLVLAGRYALLVAGAAAAVPLFLGGGAGPLLPGWGWVLVKTILVSGLLVLAGSQAADTAPRQAPRAGLGGRPAARGRPGPGRLRHRCRHQLSPSESRGDPMNTVLVDVGFWLCAVVSVVTGALVFYVDSMARATYALAVSFVAVGVTLLLMGQAYMGVIVILMMVMEMAVMAVYMVMFMGMNPALMPMSMVHSHRSSIAAGVGTFLLLGAGAVLVPWPTRRGAPTADVTSALGEAIMESHMIVMIAMGPVMVATIVAGVVLSSHRTRYDRLGDDLDRRPADDPQPGAVGR